MNYILIGLGILLMIGGIVGCIFPAVPGPPLSYIGLLLLHFTENHQFSARFLIAWAIIVVIAAGIDYIMPIWGARRFGADRRSVWGAIIGLIIGLFFFPPFGIVLGPLLGAVTAELVLGKNARSALRSGLGSFLGFLLGMTVKLAASGLMAWHFARTLFAGS